MGAAEKHDTALESLLHDARAQTRAQTKVLRSAIDNNDLGKTAEVKAWFLTAPGPRFAFAVRAAAATAVKPKPSLQKCLGIAEKLDLTLPPKEAVELILRPKGGGKHRAILNFGLRYRAGQKLLAHVLSQYHRPQPFQFTHRGHQAAIQHALCLIEAGNLWFAHLDIKEFYPSFRTEKLRENAALGGILPDKTLAGFVVGRDLEVKVRSGELHKFPTLSYSPLLWEARRGIPTGSCLSSVVAPMMVSRLPLPPAVKAVAINFEDDFLVLAPSEVARDEAVEALMAAVKDLPGGRFKLRTKSMGYLPEDEAQFLGHRIVIEDGVPRVMVSAGNHEAFVARLSEFHEGQGDFGTKPDLPWPDQRLGHCRRMTGYIRSWAAAFALCDDAAEMADFAMTGVETEVKALGLPLAAVSAGADDPGFYATDHFEFSSMS